MKNQMTVQQHMAKMWAEANSIDDKPVDMEAALVAYEAGDKFALREAALKQQMQRNSYLIEHGRHDEIW